MSPFRQWIYDQGLTIRQFASEIDVDYTTVYRWMKGHFYPEPSTMKLIKSLSQGKIKSHADLLD